MTAAQIQQTYEQGVSHHQAGRLHEAEAAYRKVLENRPNHADALHRLGALAYQIGRFEDARDLIRKAASLNPLAAVYQTNLGLTLVSLNQLDEAIIIFGRALALQPINPEAQNNLGLAYFRQGKFSQAIECYRQAIGAAPDYAQAHSNLGTALQQIDQPDAALQCFHKAISLQPLVGDFHYNLANALYKKGDLRGAIASFQKAISLNPHEPDAYVNLGNALLENDQNDAATQAFMQAIKLRPATPEAFNGLGILKRKDGDLESAIAYYRQAMSLRPNYAAAASNLGNAFQEMGQAHEAIAWYDQAIAAEPRDSNIHSNRIYCMHFDPAQDTSAICAELAKWNLRHAMPLAALIQPHANDRDPDRKLRIGYVSPDFREHVVGWNLLPLLQHHDHQHFEIYCYSSVLRPDAMTAKLQSHADVWRNILSANNQQAADMIRQDRIDILVDLSLHSATHRLLLFAQKPAPIQLTYLGYCSSTGLTAIDYRFSDPYLDPEGNNDPYAEKTIHLPHTYWCYQPGGQVPEISPLPATTNGYITFGCLNNFAKVSDPALQLWSRILLALSNSRLILHTHTGSHRKRVVDQLAGVGIAAGRIEFIGKQSFEEYMRNYSRIDIALDPFPYNGGITTCDALYMGVPVVSLAGKTAVGRAGKSILSNLQLQELVATTPEQYEQIAIEIAKDTQRLLTLRAGLRDRMNNSPLMNAKQFAKDVEAAYRHIWNGQ